MGYYNFNDDLKHAKQVEKEISNKLSERYGVQIVGEQGDTSEWDFQMVIPRTVSVEVKEDFKAQATGNIAVEYSCRGSPSGVELTKSDFYLYRVHNKEGIKHYLMETSKLKEIIDAELYWKTVNGGDKESNTLMYLFKINTFIKYAWALDF